jgi:hypothetical protein
VPNRGGAPKSLASGASSIAHVGNEMESLFGISRQRSGPVRKTCSKLQTRVGASQTDPPVTRVNRTHHRFLAIPAEPPVAIMLLYTAAHNTQGRRLRRGSLDREHKPNFPILRSVEKNGERQHDISDQT